MKLFFEGYPYNVDTIADYLSTHFYSEDVNSKLAYIPYVGYYYNYDYTKPDNSDSIFILPKVFLKDGKKPFGMDIAPEELIALDNQLLTASVKETIFDLSTWLYRAILRFYQRNSKTTITEKSKIQDVVSNRGNSTETYLDIILKLIKFQKENRRLFTMITTINTSGNNRIHWGKTINSQIPIIKNGTPVYTTYKNKNKTINLDEDIIVLYYSVLNYLSPTYHNKVDKDINYNILHPSKIESLIEGCKGTRLMKKIKHKYFTDDLVALWNILFTFFEKSEQIANRKYHEETLLVRNFNIVFEDMIDHLIGEDASVPKKLKEQVDGKIVDHIYSDNSLIDGNLSNIYFIGDSKYYKDGDAITGESLGKQFTYAKNVIQFNINILLEKGEDSDLDFRYRDKTTEGYNVTPNFFIRGTVDNEKQNYSNSSPNLRNASVESGSINRHFKDRLFDRDTLIVQTYDINFLFVLYTYVVDDSSSYKDTIRKRFRNDLITTFNKKYTFYKVYPISKDGEDAIEMFANKYFRLLLGRMFRPSNKADYLWLAFEKNSEDEIECINRIKDSCTSIEKETIPYEIGL